MILFYMKLNYNESTKIILDDCFDLFSICCRIIKFADVLHIIIEFFKLSFTLRDFYFVDTNVLQRIQNLN